MLLALLWMVNFSKSILPLPFTCTTLGILACLVGQDSPPSSTPHLFVTRESYLTQHGHRDQCNLLFVFAGSFISLQWLVPLNLEPQNMVPPSFGTISKWIVQIWFKLGGTGIKPSADSHMTVGGSMEGFSSH
jgi:hypothetical protein